MAYTTHTAPSSGGISLRSILAAVGGGFSAAFDGLSRAMVINSIGYQRLEQVERLQAKSDEDLARIGLKREDIVHHVFRDVFWH